VSSYPAPPPRKCGWPWVADGPPLSETTLSGRPWPKISVVTPSYNQGRFIEETIRSVLLQGYPNLEYIVIDGGSTDGSIEIIEKYAPWLAYWVSEPDQGQSHALNKGFEVASGDIRGYINSDDCYLSGAFAAVAERYVQDPRADLLHGDCRVVDERGGFLRIQKGKIASLDDVLDVWNVWLKGKYFMQPEVFWSGRAARRVGAFRSDLDFVMDYDYWARIIASGGKISRIDGELAAFRRVEGQKSRELDATLTELHEVAREWLWRRKLDIPMRRRLELQAAWLYERIFLGEVACSIELGESQARRWFRLLWCVVLNPALLFSPAMQFRLKSFLSRSSGA